jgi:hypothetical protein
VYEEGEIVICDLTVFEFIINFEVHTKYVIKDYFTGEIYEQGTMVDIPSYSTYDDEEIMEVQVHNDVVEILIEPKKGKGDIF